MKWDEDADLEGRSIIARAARDLGTEAERIARRRDSTVVSVRYVQQASEYLNVGRISTAVADVLLAVGILFVGSAVGVGSSYATADHQENFKTWLVVMSIVAVSIGFLFIGIAAAMKFRSR